jgi:hypothetical protein
MKNKLNIKIVNNTGKQDNGDRLSDASSEMATHNTPTKAQREKNAADKAKDK